MAKLALSVLGDDRIHLIDSKPLPVANPKSPYPQRGTPVLGKRSSWSKFPEARKGFSTMGMVFGFKLHAVTNLNGLFERWAFAAANHPDVRLARELIDPKSPPLGLEGQLVLGDKAYIGTGVLTPKRSNMGGSNGAWSESLDRVRTRRVRTPRSSEPVFGGPQPWGGEVWTNSLARARKRVESSFSTLVRSLTLQAAQVKTFLSLRTRVNLKIAAFNLLHSGVLFR